jgi:hypothetical protein
MNQEEREKKVEPKMKRYILMRRISDFGMGTIYVAIGIVVMFANQFNFKSDFTLSLPAKLFAGVALIYGGWRIYRGIKKQYFRES